MSEPCFCGLEGLRNLITTLMEKSRISLSAVVMAVSLGYIWTTHRNSVLIDKQRQVLLDDIKSIKLENIKLTEQILRLKQSSSDSELVRTPTAQRCCEQDMKLNLSSKQCHSSSRIAGDSPQNLSGRRSPVLSGCEGNFGDCPLNLRGDYSNRFESFDLKVNPNRSRSCSPKRSRSKSPKRSGIKRKKERKTFGNVPDCTLYPDSAATSDGQCQSYVKPLRKFTDMYNMELEVQPVAESTNICHNCDECQFLLSRIVDERRESPREKPRSRDKKFSKRSDRKEKNNSDLFQNEFQNSPKNTWDVNIDFDMVSVSTKPDRIKRSKSPQKFEPSTFDSENLFTKKTKSNRRSDCHPKPDRIVLFPEVENCPTRSKARRNMSKYDKDCRCPGKVDKSNEIGPTVKIKERIRNVKNELTEDLKRLTAASGSCIMNDQF